MAYFNEGVAKADNTFLSFAPETLLADVFFVEDPDLFNMTPEEWNKQMENETTFKAFVSHHFADFSNALLAFAPKTPRYRDRVRRIRYGDREDDVTSIGSWIQGIRDKSGLRPVDVTRTLGKTGLPEVCQFTYKANEQGGITAVELKFPKHERDDSTKIGIDFDNAGIAKIRIELGTRNQYDNKPNDLEVLAKYEQGERSTLAKFIKAFLPANSNPEDVRQSKSTISIDLRKLTFDCHRNFFIESNDGLRHLTGDIKFIFGSRCGKFVTENDVEGEFSIPAKNVISMALDILKLAPSVKVEKQR